MRTSTNNGNSWKQSTRPVIPDSELINNTSNYANVHSQTNHTSAHTSIRPYLQHKYPTSLHTTPTQRVILRTLFHTRIGQMNLLTSQGDDGIDEFALASRALNHVSVNRWQQPSLRMPQIIERAHTTAPSRHRRRNSYGYKSCVCPCLPYGFKLPSVVMTQMNTTFNSILSY